MVGSVSNRHSRHSRKGQAQARRGFGASRCARLAPSRRRVWHVSPEGFRELRLSVPMSRRACAAFLGCSESAVRAWDRGRNRVPGPVVRLLRLVRLGDLSVIDPAWAGWQLVGEVLRSPEGYAYSAQEFGWWSLVVRQARMWRERSTVPAPAPTPAEPVFPSNEAAPTRAAVVQSKRRGPRTAVAGAVAFARTPAAPRRLPGLVSFQKQVTRRGQKPRKIAACRRGAP